MIRQQPRAPSRNEQVSDQLLGASEHVVWLQWIVACLVGEGMLVGVLAAWHRAFGGDWIAEHGLEIPRCVAAAGVALAAVVVSPPARHGLTGGALSVAFLALAAAVAAAPLGRPAIHAAAAGLTTGAVVVSGLAWAGMLGVPVPPSALSMAFWFMVLTGGLGGWLFASQLGHEYVKYADVVRGARSALGVTRDAILHAATGMRRLGLAVLLVSAATALLIGLYVRHEAPFKACLAVVLSSMALVVLCWGLCAWFAWWAMRVVVVCAWWMVLVRRIARWTREPVFWALVAARYPKALCDTCLRWSGSHDSKYSRGHRYCEKCDGEISFHGGAGRLVALIGDQRTPEVAPVRVFVRHSAEILAAAKRVDVTHIRLVSVDDMSWDLRRFTAFLQEFEPEQGLKDVRVYPVGGRARLPMSVHNLIDDTFGWAETDPLAPGGQ